MNEVSETANEEVNRIAKERGFEAKWARIVARYDTGVLRRHHENFQGIMAMSALEQYVKELIIVAVDCCQYWPGTKIHIWAALEAGATEEQVAEAIFAGGYVAGPHSVVHGMRALDSVLEDMRVGKTPET